MSHLDEPTGTASDPVMVILAHPRSNSLNHALANQVVTSLAAAGRPVRFHDLYAERFDPVLRPDEAYTSGERASGVATASTDPVLQAHRIDVQACNGLVVVHPNWWGKPPAILAGWLDRVLVPGVAYQLAEGGGLPLPLVRLKHLLVVNTADTPTDREARVFGDPLDSIWRACVAPYVGDPRVERVTYAVVADSTAVERRAWLADVAHRTTRLFLP